MIDREQETVEKPFPNLKIMSRAGQDFLKYDKAAMHKLAPHRHDESSYISNARERIRLQEQLLASDQADNQSQNDHAWDLSRENSTP